MGGEENSRPAQTVNRTVEIVIWLAFAAGFGAGAYLSNEKMWGLPAAVGGGIATAIAVGVGLGLLLWGARSAIRRPRLAIGKVVGVAVIAGALAIGVYAGRQHAELGILAWVIVAGAIIVGVIAYALTFEDGPDRD